MRSVHIIPKVLIALVTMTVSKTPAMTVILFFTFKSPLRHGSSSLRSFGSSMSRQERFRPLWRHRLNLETRRAKFLG